MVRRYTSARTAVTAPKPVLPAIRNITRIWYFYRVGRRHSVKYLPGHHPRQRNHAGYGSRIDDGHRRAAERLAGSSINIVSHSVRHLLQRTATKPGESCLRRAQRAGLPLSSDHRRSSLNPPIDRRFARFPIPPRELGLSGKRHRSVRRSKPALGARVDRVTRKASAPFGPALLSRA